MATWSAHRIQRVLPPGTTPSQQVRPVPDHQTPTRTRIQPSQYPNKHNASLNPSPNPNALISPNQP
eukprot:6577508-Pyramimonas_sp.AAC.1